MFTFLFLCKIKKNFVTSSELGDKLKAARIAYFKRLGTITNMADGPLDEDIVLSTSCIPPLDDKTQTKEEEKKRSTWVRPWLARNGDFTINF